MPRVRDLLSRFRPSGAPGAPSAAGVPVDRTAELDAELAPVFAQLAPTERSCEAVVEAALAEAAGVRERAAERVRTLLATAAEDAPAERASAAAARHTGRLDEAAEVERAAEGEVAELRTRTARLLPGYVEEVATSIRRLLDTPRPATSERGGA